MRISPLTNQITNNNYRINKQKPAFGCDNCTLLLGKLHENGVPRRNAIDWLDANLADCMKVGFDHENASNIVSSEADGNIKPIAKSLINGTNEWLFYFKDRGNISDIVKDFINKTRKK